MSMNYFQRDAKPKWALHHGIRRVVVVLTGNMGGMGFNGGQQLFGGY